jgi:uncharacterized protein YceK
MQNVFFAFSLLAAITLSGCSNLTNVRTFADATTTVTASTAAMVKDDQDSCRRRYQFEIEYYKVIKAPDKEAKATSRQQERCKKLADQVKAILALNGVLQNYAAGLSALAQDSFVTYKGEIDETTAALTALQKSTITSISDPEIAAAGKLIQFIASAATEGYRQKKLAEAMNDEMKKAVDVTVAALNRTATAYEAQLYAEAGTVDVVLIGLDTLAANEPLALLEYHRRMEQLAAAVEEKKKAIATYKQTLATMSDAYNDAANDLANPSRKEIGKAVIDYAKRAYAVEKDMHKAFGSN